MNGAMIPTMGVRLPATASNANGVNMNVAGVNSQRISTVSERLAMCAQSNNPEAATVFTNLCISLSRGIDFAIANNEIPAEVSSLPKVCKLVCRRGEDSNLQAPIMVLMVTMKHACEAKWFSTQETQEVLSLTEEVARIFNTSEGISSGQINTTIVSQIMSRYYPRIKLGHVLASVEIKPGFEACAVDFHISKQMSHGGEKRIQLLVIMKDNIETSSCIITPQKVNFLLNGRAVIGRTVGHMEIGPQLPTVVTTMLRYGTNLLQAIGHFDAHYIVVIAFMGDIASSFLPVPEDYAQTANVTVESDAELEEGPWRISLNCPITFTRIKRPAKGKGCKHLQCFDLSNFLDMNSRCPSWKCPSCNRSVCYPDLRIDQNMFKILQEVEKSVSTVIIKTDGSWDPISGNDDRKDEPVSGHKENTDEPESSALPNDQCNIFDLTQGDDDMIITYVDMPQDTKPVVNSDLLNTSTPQVQGVSSTRTNLQPAGAPRPNHFTPSPVLTDSVSLAARQIQQAVMGNNQQSSTPSPTNPVQLQHAPRQQLLSTVYGGSLRGISGSSPVMSTGLRNTSPLPSRGEQSHLSASQMRTLIQYSSSMRNPPRPTASTPSQPRPISSPQLPNQARSTPSPVLNNTYRPTTSTPNQPRPISSPQLPNQARSTPSPVLNNTPQSTSPLQISNHTPQPSSNNQTPQPARESLLPHMLSTPPHLRARAQTQPGRAPINPQYLLMTPPAATTLQPSPLSRPRHPAPYQMPTSRANPSSAPTLPPPGRLLQTVSRTQDLVDLQTEVPNWQSDGKMRGSLTGRNFSESLSQFVIRPTQQTPPSQVSNLQDLIGNRNPNPNQNNNT